MGVLIMVRYNEFYYALKKLIYILFVLCKNLQKRIKDMKYRFLRVEQLERRKSMLHLGPMDSDGILKVKLH